VPFGALQQLLGVELSPQQARWAARTLIHYVLGFVAEEQNHAELIRARIATSAQRPDDGDVAFRFGVTAILRGLPAPAGRGADSLTRAGSREVLSATQESSDRLY